MHILTLLPMAGDLDHSEAIFSCLVLPLNPPAISYEGRQFPKKAEMCCRI